MSEIILQELEPRRLLSAIVDSTFDAARSVVSLGSGSAITTLGTLPGGKMLATARGGGTLAGRLNLLRYNANGALDTTFGRRGLLSEAIPNFTGNYLSVGTMRFQKNGQIVVGGVVGQLTGTGSSAKLSNNHALLARLNADGSLDPTFAARGAFIEDDGSSGRSGFLSSHVDSSDGIFVTGYLETSSTSQFQIRHFLSTGALDANFGASGVKIVNFTAAAEGTTIALRTDGTIDAVGNVSVTTNGTTQPAVAVVHLDAHGNILWQKQLPDIARAAGVELAKDGTLVVGEINRFGGQLFRLNAATGTQIAHEIIDDHATFGKASPTGGAIFTENGEDFMLIMVNAQGCSIASTTSDLPTGYFFMDRSFGQDGYLYFVNVDDTFLVSQIEVQSSGDFVFAGHTKSDLTDARLERIIPRPGSIEMRNFRDENRDQVKSVDEPWILGTPLWLDTNNNGRYDRGEPSARSTGYSSSTFSDLAPGKYVLREQVLTGWRATGLTARTVVVTADHNSIISFGSYVIANLGGTLIDYNTRAPLSAWTMFIDNNGNGVLDTGEQSTTTDSNGQWYFGHLTPGTYAVKVQLMAGWSRVYADSTTSAARIFAMSVPTLDLRIAVG